MAKTARGKEKQATNNRPKLWILGQINNTFSLMKKQMLCTVFDLTSSTPILPLSLQDAGIKTAPAVIKNKSLPRIALVINYNKIQKIHTKFKKIVHKWELLLKTETHKNCGLKLLVCNPPDFCRLTKIIRNIYHLAGRSFVSIVDGVQENRGCIQVYMLCEERNERTSGKVTTSK